MKNQSKKTKLSQKELKKRRLDFFLKNWMTDLEKKVKGGYKND